MKVSLYGIILPRLEVFFLEEWIEHHLKFGVDHFYIYDTGLIPTNNQRCGRELTPEEVGVKWNKKPDADYFLEYSDLEICEKLLQVVEKYRNNVTLTSWQSGIQCRETENRHLQVAGYKHCLERHKSDWWVHIDPDEFMCSKAHPSLTSLLRQAGELGVHSIHMGQRVFEKRQRNQPVKQLYRWGYDAPEITKSLSRSPLKKFESSEIGIVHKIKSQNGSKTNVPMDTLRINHYRGMDIGGLHESYAGASFNKLDDSISKVDTPNG